MLAREEDLDSEAVVGIGEDVEFGRDFGGFDFVVECGDDVDFRFEVDVSEGIVFVVGAVSVAGFEEVASAAGTGDEAECWVVIFADV